MLELDAVGAALIVKNPDTVRQVEIGDGRSGIRAIPNSERAGGKTTSGGPHVSSNVASTKARRLEAHGQDTAGRNTASTVRRATRRRCSGRRTCRSR